MAVTRLHGVRSEAAKERQAVRQMEFVGVSDGKVSFRQNGTLFHVKPKPLTEAPKTA